MNTYKEDTVINSKRICEIVLTIYATCSMSYVLNLMTEGSGFSQSAFSILLFLLLFAGVHYVIAKLEQIEDSRQRKRRICYVFVTGLLLGLAFVMGYQLRMQGMTSLGVKGKLLILLAAGGVSVALSPFVNGWFGLLDGREVTDMQEEKVQKAKAQEPKTQESKTQESKSQKSKPQDMKAQDTKTLDVAVLKTKTMRGGRVFLFSWAVIFCCWIPAFLAYYPAIMSYDFNRQSIWAHQGYIWFTTHHPLIHTFLIKCFFDLGKAIGSYEIAMALFSLMQMLILSAVYAYSCNMIGRLTGKKWAVAVTVLLFALLPLHSVMVLCMTKDVLFSAFLLLFLLLILERRMYFSRQEAKKGRLLLFDIALLLTGVLMLLFRNNAVYAFVVFAVFYVLWSKRERGPVLVLCVLIAVGGVGVNAGMKAVMGAGEGSAAEKYSVFMQQMCRTALNHENTLTEEEWSVLNYYVSCEYWHDYNPTIADSIKGNVTVTSFQSWKDDIPQMLKDWAKMGLRYPNDYIDAFLAMTMGYWFPDDVSHAEVLGYGEDSNYGLIYTFNASASEFFEGVESRSYLPKLQKWYQKIVNGNAYYDIPVLSNLFKPAFYCWALVLVMISFVYRRQRGKLVLCMLPFWYLMTLLLGPVVNIRYVYPIIAAIPFLLAWLYGSEERDVY